MTEHLGNTKKFHRDVCVSAGYNISMKPVTTHVLVGETTSIYSGKRKSFRRMLPRHLLSRQRPGLLIGLMAAPHM